MSVDRRVQTEQPGLKNLSSASPFPIFLLIFPFPLLLCVFLFLSVTLYNIATKIKQLVLG